MEKLKTAPKDLTKLRNIVDNDVIEKTIYDKLVVRKDKIDASVFALKIKWDTDKSGLVKKWVIQKRNSWY